MNIHRPGVFVFQRGMMKPFTIGFHCDGNVERVADLQAEAEIATVNAELTAKRKRAELESTERSMFTIFVFIILGLLGLVAFLSFKFPGI
jgi:hypothetical protein